MKAVVSLFLLITSAYTAEITFQKVSPQQLRIAISPSEGTYTVEQSSDLQTFVPIGSSANYFMVPSSEGVSFFRARKQTLSDSYIGRAQISSPATQNAVESWLTTIGAEGYLEHAVYMASYLPEHVGTFTTNLPAMLGGNGRCNRPAAFTGGGLIFDGGFYLELPNPLPETLEELSIFAVFSSKSGDLGLLVGNDAGEGRAGPAFWVGGNPYLYLDPQNLAFSCTADGKAVAQPGFRAASTFNWGNLLTQQISLASVGPDSISIATDFDRQYSVPITSGLPVANPGSAWRVGARMDGLLPFEGTVAFVAVFDRKLEAADLAFLRETYRKSIGQSVRFPAVQLIIEGDSLSEEAFGTEYGRWLHDEPHWRGQFSKRNIASYGQTTGQMLTEFDSEVPPAKGERNYLFLWGGRNDVGFYEATDIFGRLKSYWERARQAGYKVGAFTIIPAAYEKSEPVTAARRQALNELIRGATADYDVLFDVDALPTLQDPTNLTYFKPDGVHITAEGSKAIADLIDQLLPP